MNGVMSQQRILEKLISSNPTPELEACIIKQLNVITKVFETIVSEGKKVSDDFLSFSSPESARKLNVSSISKDSSSQARGVSHPVSTTPFGRTYSKAAAKSGHYGPRSQTTKKAVVTASNLKSRRGANPRYVIGPVFGVQQNTVEDELSVIRAPKRRAYRATDLFFSGFQKMPLSQLGKTLCNVVPAKFILKISFVRRFLRITVWLEDAKKVSALLKQKSFITVSVDPLSPHMLASSMYDTRTAAEKAAISKSYFDLHAEEVRLTLHYRVAKREKQPEEEIVKALASLQKFTYSVKNAAKPTPVSNDQENSAEDRMDIDSLESDDVMQMDIESEDSEDQPLKLQKKARVVPAEETGQI